jgi:hypothetical protein
VPQAQLPLEFQALCKRNYSPSLPKPLCLRDRRTSELRSPSSNTSPEIFFTATGYKSTGIIGQIGATVIDQGNQLFIHSQQAKLRKVAPKSYIKIHEIEIALAEPTSSSGDWRVVPGASVGIREELVFTDRDGVIHTPLPDVTISLPSGLERKGKWIVYKLWEYEQDRWVEYRRYYPVAMDGYFVASTAGRLASVSSERPN